MFYIYLRRLFCFFKYENLGLRGNNNANVKGAGYIGSHFVAEVSKQHEVVVLDNLSKGHREAVPEHVTFIKGDISSEQDLDIAFALGIDAVFHFCASIEVFHYCYPGIFSVIKVHYLCKPRLSIRCNEGCRICCRSA